MTRRSDLRYLGKLRWILLALTPSACFHPSTTTRVVDGEATAGRYVSPTAYSSVMQAALLEAQGKLQLARDAYLQATGYDGDSPEIWTRIGAIDCQLRDAESSEAFDRAQAIDARYEPLWRERARCSLSQGNAKAAFEEARHAVALDPDKAESTELVARSLELSGDARAAEQWRRGFLVASRTSESTPAPPAGTVSILDAALAEPDLTHARALALDHGISAAGIALRAVEIGHLKQALLQAQLVLGANPSNADARVAALVAADLSGDEARFSAFLVTPAGTLQPLDARARKLLNELLVRRSSVAASP